MKLLRRLCNLSLLTKEATRQIKFVGGIKNLLNTFYIVFYLLKLFI